MWTIYVDESFFAALGAHLNFALFIAFEVQASSKPDSSFTFVSKSPLTCFSMLNSDPTSLAEDFENEALLPQNIPEELVWYQDKVRRRLQLLEFLERSSWWIEVKSNFFIYLLLLV